jgi:hypothetical protein
MVIITLNSEGTINIDMGAIAIMTTALLIVF